MSAATTITRRGYEVTDSRRGTSGRSPVGRSRTHHGELPVSEPEVGVGALLLEPEDAVEVCAGHVLVADAAAATHVDRRSIHRRWFMSVRRRRRKPASRARTEGTERGERDVPRVRERRGEREIVGCRWLGWTGKGRASLLCRAGAGLFFFFGSGSEYDEHLIIGWFWVVGS